MIVSGTRGPRRSSQTGWGAFSFVEAAVLIVAAGVLTLLFQRAEARAFHLPGGDGGVILAAGLWTCLLIVWRIFDKQGATTSGPSATTSSGIEWGIFVALAAAAFLAYAGSGTSAPPTGPSHRCPARDTAPAGSSAAATRSVREDTTTVREAATTTAAAGERHRLAAATTAARDAGPRRQAPARAREPGGGASAPAPPGYATAGRS